VLRVEPEIVQKNVAAGQVQLVFWHVLDHRQSAQAHQGAECAGQQSPMAFWQMHDTLFERQGELWNLENSTLVTLAGELGLDTASFESCLSDQTVIDKIARMDQERRAAGIRLRPSFDVNGQIIQGAVPYDSFAQLFDRLLVQ
jgi:protein-disulfide isomerase